MRAQMAAQRVEETSEPSQPIQPAPPPVSPQSEQVLPQTTPVPQSEVARAATTPAVAPASEDTVTVKQEIRKTLLTILVLVAIIVAVYFVNLKTDFILKIGEFLSKNLNVNI